MHTHPFRITMFAFGLSLSLAAPIAASAAPGCAGEACDVLSMSTDGCSWKNASDKAIRFTVLNSGATLFSSVLGPGESFKQSNKQTCVTAQPGSPNIQASFVALRSMPDAPDFTLKPKPATVPATTVASAPKIAVPRAKPVPDTVVATADPALTPAALAAVPARRTPTPRAKPDMPSTPASPPSTSTALVSPAQTIKVPTEAEIEAGVNPCGDACGEILFKVVDECIWVQSQNPRPIIFQATVQGRMLVLPLDGASAAKADAGAPPANAPAYHTRQRDPFQSASSGIPVYRVRLGEPQACVKDRTQITQFVAQYKK